MRRWVPLLVLLCLAALAYAAGLHRHLTWAALAANQATLAAWVAAHPLAAPLAAAALYAAAVALSLPGAVILTLACGLLFGAALGGAVALLGATSGAVAVFLIARHAFADLLARRFGTLAARLRPGLERDGFAYLLALRLIPAFPFWLVNLAPALAGMRLAPFAAATFLGIMPAAFVYAGIGAGLGEALAAGRQPDLGTILTPGVLAPLLGLAILALLPVAWRHWKGAHG